MAPRSLLATITIFAALLALVTSTASAAPVPRAELELATESLIGESTTLKIRFDNVAQDLDAEGYGPFLDLVLPVIGFDGDGDGEAPDGLGFLGATYLGIPVDARLATFPADPPGRSCVEHPLAKGADRQPLEVCGRSGDQLLTLVVPFGSFVPHQPAAEIEVLADLSPLADVGGELEVRARAGFTYGADPLDNPDEDPALLEYDAADSSVWPVARTRGEIARLDQRYLGPEDETATGPNFPRRYEILLDIADGQTLENLELRHRLAPQLAFLDVISISPPGSLVSAPPPGAPAPAAENELRIEIPSVTGGPGERDAVVVVEFFAPRFDAAGDEILDPISGDERIVTSGPSAVATWRPIDPRDPATIGNLTLSGDDAEHRLSLQSIAIQKSVAAVDADGADRLSPGDALRYRLDFQLSDYFTFDQLSAEDLFSDGQRLDPSTPLHLSFTRHGQSAEGPLGGEHFTVEVRTGADAVPRDGQTRLDLDLAAGLDELGVAGPLPGGCVAPQGSGDGGPSCASFDAGATFGELVFKTLVQQSYSDDYPSGDASVDEGDQLWNEASIEARLLGSEDLDAPSPTGAREDDSTQAEIALAMGRVSTDIYAVNGAAVDGGIPEIFPGDRVTFRLSHTLTTANFEDLVLEDFLPMPVFEATELITLQDIRSAQAPPAGTAWLAPGDTFRQRAGGLPQLSTSAVAGSVRFDFATFDDAIDAPARIEILITLTVTEEPFADDLLLTQHLHASQKTTQLLSESRDAIAQIRLRQPRLELALGAVATDATGGEFIPAAIGPMAFSLPAASDTGPWDAFADPITGAAWDAAPIRSDLDGVDAGDLVAFAVSVLNRGGGAAYDLALQGTLPDGFVLPQGGARLQVTRGDGLVLSTQPRDPADGGAAFFFGGLDLVDPDGGPALEATSPGNHTGGDLLVLTYVLEVDGDTEPGSAWEHRAELLAYGGAEGAAETANHLDFHGQISGAATVKAKMPELDFQITGTTAAHTGEIDPQRPLAIGERVRFQVRLDIPEGTQTDASLLLTLDTGVRFEAVEAIVPSQGLETSRPVGFTGLAAEASVAADGSMCRIDFGHLVNHNRDGDAQERILVDIVAYAEAGDVGPKEIRASWHWGASSLDVAAPPLRVLTPALEITKNAEAGGGDGGDRVTYRLEIQHAPGSDVDAFDLVISDPLSDPALSLIPGSLRFEGAAAQVLEGQGAGDEEVTVVIDHLPLGHSTTLLFDARIADDVASGSNLVNRAELEWSSLPGVADDELLAGPVGAEHRLGITPVSVTKGVLTTSDPATGSAAFEASIPDLTPGEEVVYELEITVPEGSATSLVVSDQLPIAPGLLELVSVEGPFLGEPGHLSFEIPTPTPWQQDLLPLGDPDGLVDAVSWAFGTVSNPPDGFESAADRFTLRVRARLRDLPVNKSSGEDVYNAVQVSYGSSLLAVDSAAIEIVEPKLRLTASPTPAQGDAGDAIELLWVVKHRGASNATAFDLEWRDILDPAHLVYAPDLGPLRVGGSDPGCQEAEVDDDAAATEGLVVRWPSLDEGEVCQVRFTARLAASVVAGSTLSNPATLTWDNRQADAVEERAGERSATASVAITEPSLVKEISATSIGSTGSDRHGPAPDATIGELVTYRLTLTFPDGVIEQASWVDELPRAHGVLAHEAFRVVSVGADLEFEFDPEIPGALVTEDSLPVDGTVDRLSLFFGRVSNAIDVDPGLDDIRDQLILEVDALVIDGATNNGQDGDALRGSASLSFDGDHFTAVADLDLVEPLLGLTKTSRQPFVDAFDLVQVDLQIGHAADSTADAFGLQVVDRWPVGIASFESLVAEECPGELEVSTGDGPYETIFRLAAPLPLGATCTLSYRMRLGAEVEPAVTYHGPATLSWDSTPAGEAPRPEANRRRAASASGAVTILAPTVVKLVSTTDLVETAASFHDPATVDLTIGEEVCYELEAFFPEGVTRSTTLEDLLPAGAGGALGLSSATLMATGSDLSFTGSGTVSASDEIGQDGVLDTVRVELGDVTNSSSDNLMDERDRVLLQVCARLLDRAAHVDGATLQNRARLAFGGFGQAGDSADIEVVEPAMALSKTFVDLEDDVATVQVDLRNEGTAPAFDLEVIDELAEQLWVTAEVEALSAAPGFLIETRDGETGLTVAMVSDPAAGRSPLAPGESASFLFRAPLRPAAFESPQTSVANRVVNRSASTWPGTAAIERELDDIEATAYLEFAQIEVTKTGTLVVDADLSGTLSPGDTVRYDLHLSNRGGATASQILLVDRPDALTQVIVESMMTEGEASFTQSPDAEWRVRFPSLAPDATLSLHYQVVVGAMPVNIAEIRNQAVVSFSERSVEVLSDDPTTPAADDATRLLVVAWLDLALDFSAAPAEASPSSTLAYRLDWLHRGQRTATGASLRFELPPSTSLGADSAAWTCDADRLCTLSLGQIEPGESGSVDLALELSPVPDISLVDLVLEASIVDDGSQGADPTPANNLARAEAPIRRPGDKLPRLDKTLLHSPQVAIGGSVTYEWTLLLPEASSISAATLVDILPPKLELEELSELSLDGLTISGNAVPGVVDGRSEWQLGRLENPDNDPTTDETLRVTVQARLANLAANQAGTRIESPVSLSWPGGELSGAVEIEVVEPALAVRTTFEPSSAEYGDEIRAHVQVRHLASSSATAFEARLRETLPPELVYLGEIQALNGPEPVAEINAQDLQFTFPHIDLAPGVDTPVEFSFLLRFEGDGRADRSIHLDWTSQSGDPGQERSGDAEGPAGELNDYRANDQAQLGNSRIYGFEDLKNDPERHNDFDYNDWVIRVEMDESIDELGRWTRLELEIEALARGAGFRHLPFLDLGLAGDVDLLLRRFAGDGTLLETREIFSSGEIVRDIQLFPHTYAALPRWLGQPFDFSANTSPGHGAADRIAGERVVLVAEIGEPERNPAVADDSTTQHLNETFNHLIGPWIRVIETGQVIRHRWRGSSTTQDIVTPGLYGAETPLLGYPLDQSQSFEGTWRWPVEQIPSWQAYPAYVDYVASGGTQEKSWFESSAPGAAWPVDQPLPPAAGGEAPTGASTVAELPPGSFTFDHHFAGPVASSPAISDLDGDGVWEVIVGAYSGEIVIHDHRGRVRRVLTATAGEEAPSMASVTVADLDGDELPEIIRGDDRGTVRAFRPDGSIAATWQLGATVKSTAAIADLGEDDDIDVIVVDGLGRLHALGLGGSQRPGFPVTLGGLPDVSNGFSILPSPTLADLDGDGHLDIVIVDNGGTIFALDAAGAALPGWPRHLGVTVLSTAAVADLEEDGDLEVVIADDAGGVHVFAADGAILWQARRTLGGPSSPALGDLDGDGSLDVVVGSMDGRVYAWHGAGQHAGQAVAGWPFITSSAVQASPTVADLDGDERAEVLIGSFDRNAYALTGAGEPLPGDGLPARLGAILFASAAIADLDQNGQVEMVIGSHDRRLYALELPSQVPKGARLWSQFGGGATHGGVGDITGPEAQDQLPPTFSVHVGGLELNPCEPLRTPPTEIEIQFSEPLGETATAAVDGGALRVIAAGADDDFQSVLCGASNLGDDREVMSQGAWSSPTRIRLSLPTLRSGLYRVEVCAGLEDAAGNALDGDDDGVGGDDGQRFLRLDTGNLFENGHFDCSLRGWATSGETGAVHRSEDALSSPHSGSAGLLSSGEAQEWLEQCVDVNGGQGLTLRAEMRGGQGVPIESFLGCSFFAAPACAGPELATELEVASLGGGSWRDHAFTTRAPVAASSALCFVGLRGDDLDVGRLDHLRLEGGLFRDDFESGNIYNWSHGVNQN